MSRMADLDLEIREMLDEGLRPTSIASILNIPLEMVYEFVDAIETDEIIVYGYDED